jgi:hypothetical protein
VEGGITRSRSAAYSAAPAHQTALISSCSPHHSCRSCSMEGPRKQFRHRAADLGSKTERHLDRQEWRTVASCCNFESHYWLQSRQTAMPNCHGMACMHRYVEYMVAGSLDKYSSCCWLNRACTYKACKECRNHSAEDGGNDILMPPLCSAYTRGSEGCWLMSTHGNRFLHVTAGTLRHAME